MSVNQQIPIVNLFPVFDIIFEQIRNLPNRDELFSDAEIHALKLKIESITDKTGRDMIYVILRIHSLRNVPDSHLLDLPYSSEVVTSRVVDNERIDDLKFDLRNLPPFLLRMLSHFSDLHIRRITEDQKRLNQIKLDSS